MVYVDAVSFYPTGAIKTAARKHGNRWSHLFSDDEEELHLFARGIGLRKEWFQDKGMFHHYDLTPYMRNLAILRGAKQIRLIDFLREVRGCNIVISP